MNNRKLSSLVKPEAPHNSNQFLIEDQGRTEEIDERLRSDKVATRNRDSSFSVDSDGEFYSSPSDEEEFLIKDFDDQYESLHVERLNGMSKGDLVQEFLLLEKKLDATTKRLRCKGEHVVGIGAGKKEALTFVSGFQKRRGGTRRPPRTRRLESKCSG